jgi:hypothetical protein
MVSESIIFLNNPQLNKNNPCPACITPSRDGIVICGKNWDALTIGPATSCGKKLI